MQTRNKSSRKAFTLVELLIVVSIIALIAAATMPVVTALTKNRLIRDASQVVQVTLAHARDIAIRENRPIGVRFIPDAIDPELCRTMVLIESPGRVVGSRPGDPPATIHLVRGAAAVTSGSPDRFIPGVPLEQYESSIPVNLVVPGANTSFDANIFKSNGVPDEPDGVIRFEDSGPFYLYQYLDQNGTTPARLLLLNDLAIGPNAKDTSINPQVLPRLPAFNYNPATFSPTTAGNATTRAQFLSHLQGQSGMKFEVRSISNSNVLADSDPITLPGGVVIDFGQLPYDLATGNYIYGNTPDPATNRLSRLEARTNNTDWSWEITFAPNGQVMPPQTTNSNAGIWLREEAADVLNQAPVIAGIRGRKCIRTSSGARAHTIISVHTRTGYVSAHQPVFERNPGAASQLDQEVWTFEAYYKSVSRQDRPGL